jgi:predicted dehydrogenase
LHALALRSAGVAIEYVFDPKRERAEWLADLVGGIPTCSLDVDVDVAAICSPPSVHVDQAVAVARAGRVTFVEKPIALNHDELARLRELPGIVPVLQWRAGRSASHLRSAFDAFGADVDIACDLRLWRDDDYFAQRPDWRCGAMLSIGIHAIDLVLWIVGKPIRSSYFSEPDPREGSLKLEFVDGTSAQIRITLSAKGHNDLRLIVRGSNASAELRASEEDPTALPLKWRGAEPPEAIGADGSPLLVPFIHNALAGNGPTVADVAAAHALAFTRV